MSTPVRSTYRFARLPEWVLWHPGLQSGDVRLFATLDRFDGRDCFPALATLADKLDCTEQTIRRSLHRLEQVGAIRIEDRYDWNGRQTSNRYILAGDNPLPPITEVTPVPITDDTLPPISGDTQSRASNDPEQDDPSLSSSSDLRAALTDPAERDFLESTLQHVVTLLVAKAKPDNPLAYRAVLAAQAESQHLSAIERLRWEHPEWEPVRIACEYVGASESREPAPPWIADPDCAACEGDGFVGDERGYGPCDCRVYANQRTTGP